MRLSKELVEPGGCTHGSSLLNRDFRKLLKRRIEGQREKIETRQYTLEGILDEQVLEFEDRLKRRANIYSLKARLEILKIKGLEADPGKRLREGIVELNQ